MSKLIDNINNKWGDDIKATLKVNSKLQIAASCFSIYAYEALKKELAQIDSLQFIFTEPTFIANQVTDKLSKQRREFYIPKKQRERNLYGSEFEIHLKNKLTQRAVAKECANWIRKKVTFKSNATQASMQQYACVQNANNTATYTSIQGFTAVDLGYQQGSAISNIISKDESENTQVWLTLFDQIWDDNANVSDVTDAIISHIEAVYQENSPEKIYFFILYNIFNEFLEDINEDVMPNDKTGYQDSKIWKKLYQFQTDAAIGIINKLENYNGCILADSVGLGKTFTALAVIKYYQLRNRNILVMCPKKLGDNWQTFKSNYKTNILVDDRLNYDLLFHTDLSRDKGESMGLDLGKINWGNYDLVVIDESHNFRNNDAYKEKETRYQKLMRTVIKAGVKTKVLMLSATPVNNRFLDLKNQLALAYEGDSEQLNSKLNTNKSIEEIFRSAQKAFNDWSKLPAEKRTAEAILTSLSFDFFEVLDSVTIARSRKHIETYYNIAEIGNFPKRLKPVSIRCKLTHLNSVMNINEIYEHLMQIKQIVYTPMLYVYESRKHLYIDSSGRKKHDSQFLMAQANGIKKLMTTNLLKRLESSVQSFRLTLKQLQQNIEKQLQNIDNKVDIENFEVGDIDEDEYDSIELKSSTVKNIDLDDIDIESWKRDLEEDLTLVVMLLEEMEKIKTVDDFKLQHLVNHIKQKIANPINQGNKKVLVFTAFADTADYLYQHITKELSNQGIESAKVTGSATPQTTLKQNHNDSYDFQKILTLFSPISKDKALLYPEKTDNIDVLIGTDCISEGQNLQDCDYVINYDIHWNPVRIIQRFGRIDRIGSQNKTIQLVNYWPDISLDDYINLKERVEDRMVIADVTATGDDNVLSAKANDVSYRQEQLKRLQDEVVDLEELKTGINITDLGLNDFRMDLHNHKKDQDNLSKIPNGIHAVIPANKNIGLLPGVIFTLKNKNNAVNIDKQNRLHPFYLIYISEDGTVIKNQTEVKALLDLIKSSCKGTINPITDLCTQFNQQTKDGKNMQFYSDILDKAIMSMMTLKEQKDVDSLFTSTNTTALEHSISGLDDFELIAFLVVK